MRLNISTKHATMGKKPTVEDKDMVEGQLYIYTNWSAYSTLSNGKKMLFIKQETSGSYNTVQNIGYNANKNTPFQKGTVITLTQNVCE